MTKAEQQKLKKWWYKHVPESDENFAKLELLLHRPAKTKKNKKKHTKKKHRV